jgi:hypothetical protein
MPASAPSRPRNPELGMFGERVEHTADDELLQAMREGRE